MKLEEKYSQSLPKNQHFKSLNITRKAEKNDKQNTALKQ